MRQMKGRGVVPWLKLWILALILTLWCGPNHAQAGSDISRAVILSARVENGSVTYTLNGRRVEDRKDNSLLTKLTALIRARGAEIPVLIIIDVRASFREAGKLETALDKAGLTRYRLFVTDFRNGVMNEVHWEQTPVPIPPT